MKPFDLTVLLWPATVIFVSTAVVAFKVSRAPAFSLFSGFIKSGIFLGYFGYAFDGTYTFLDDWSYLQGGEELHANGVGVSNLGEHWVLALTIGRGEHFVYYLYNTYAFRLFGVGYYAPVALNVLLTLAIAWIGARLAQREGGFSQRSTRYFFAFLLLHPDILAWSNIMNGKDVLVLLLHVILLFSASLFFRSHVKTALLLAVSVSTVLTFLRFYVPILFAVALMASLILGGGTKGRLRFLGAAIFAAAALTIGELGFQHVLLKVREHFVNPLYGFVRIVLTPIPFNTEKSYAFLDIPALIHWVLMPFVVVGMIQIYRLNTPYWRFFLAYVFVFIGVYAVFGELQGPRHRVQLDYAWAVFQFLGLMTALHSVAKAALQRLPATNNPVGIQS